MNTIDIVCDSCNAQMRLSSGLLARVAGKTGRVSCKRCDQKVTLDGRGGDVVITSGALVMEALELEEVRREPEAPTSFSDPHFSEFPTAPALSMRPPLPLTARHRKSQLPVASAVKQDPVVAKLAEQIRHANERRAELDVPPARAQEDSLSPHALDSDEEEGLASLKHEFRSSPFSSERDETYRSLYPKVQKAHNPAIFEAPAPIFSTAPRSPSARESRRASTAEIDLFADALSVPAGKLSLGDEPDTSPAVSTAPKTSAAPERTRGRHVPWAIAAISLLALGVSLGIPAEQATSSADPARVVVLPDAPTGNSPSTTVATAPSSGDVSDVRAESQAAARIEAKAPASEAPRAKSDDARNPEAPLESKSATETAPETKDPSADESGPQAPPFSAGAAAVALREAAALAQGCRSAAVPTGSATVVVTFAPSGRVTRASVSGAPYAGTATGGCIAARFRAARVPEFSGDFVTVTKTVAID